MFKITLTLAALATLAACGIPNGYDPVAAAAQDRHNEALKATYTPEGLRRPTATGTVVIQ